jgi:hypothetical protein
MQLSPSHLPTQVYAVKAWKASKLSVEKRASQLNLIIGGTGSSQGGRRWLRPWRNPSADTSHEDVYSTSVCWLRHPGVRFENRLV